MTDGGADPVLLQKLQEVRVAVERESAEISEQVSAIEGELAEQARLAKEANEQLCRELDEQVEQRRGEHTEDAGKHDRQADPAWNSATHVAPRARGDVFDEDDFSNTSWLG